MKISILIQLARRTRLLPIMVIFSLALFHAVAWAAPYHGKTFTYGHPDGELFTVRLWGDEFFVYEETEDGYLITRDEQTSEYCYAKVIKNGAEIISTGVRVGEPKPRGLQPRQRLAPEVAMEKSRPRREAFGVDDKGRLKPELRMEFLKNGLENKRALQRKLGIQPDATAEDDAKFAPGDPDSLATGDEPLYAPPSSPTLGARRGLVLLASFPDRPQDVVKTPQDIDRFFNDPNYTDDGNAASIYGYFHKQSGGKLRYNNVVTAYFTAKNQHDYYTDPNRSGAIRELIIEGLEAIDAGGFDFTQCDADGNNVIDGINIFYAGKNDYNGIPNSFTKGLWPQKNNTTWSGLTAHGMSTGFQYQITDLPAAPSIATTIHENGHMICNYPDLYPYNSNAANVGNYSVMSAFNGQHPGNIDPYLKIASGWANVTDLNSSSQFRGAVQVGNNFFYRYRNPARTNEYFLIESRHNVDYEGPYGGANYSVNPTSGLVVYHAMESGSNTQSSIVTGANPVSYNRPFELMLVEASPTTSATPWYTDPSPASNDGFKAGGVTELSDSTFPELKFWSSTGRTITSGMHIHSISAAGQNMSFTIGSGAVTGSPAIGITSGELSSAIQSGGNAPNQQFAIFNSGSGTFNYTVSDDAAWLSVTPASGSVTDAEIDTCTVSYTASGLAVGVHTATITISSPEASNSPRTIAVTMQVEEAATVPVFVTQPVGADLVEGDNYTITALAQGNPSPSYEWFRNGQRISGATANTHVISGAKATDAGTYHVIAFNYKGQVTSNSVAITINQRPIITRITPTSPVSNIAPGAGLVLVTDITDDDGVNDPIDIAWSVVSAPGGGVVTWANQDNQQTEATFSANGTYKLRVTASDGVLTKSDDFVVNVTPSAPVVSNDQLIAHYPFNEVSATQITDVSGGNLHGTLEGGAIVSNAVLELDGTSNWAVVPSDNLINLSGTYAKRTIALWFRADEYPVGKQQLIFEEGGVTAGLNIFLDSGNLVCYTWNSNGGGSASGSTTVSSADLIPGKWNHVTMVLDASPTSNTLQAGALRTYLNGQLAASAGARRLDTHANGIGIGRINSGTRYPSIGTRFDTDHFGGAVHDFRLYNRALTAGEISNLHMSTNLGPIVDAGPDVVGTTSLPLALDGTVSDDGLPLPSTITASWSIVSGPGSGTFANPSAVDTTFIGDAPGTYTLRLATNDGYVTTFDTTTCTVSNLSGPGAVRFTDAYFHAAETAGTMSVTVERPMGLGSDGAISVSYAASDGTALNGTDYNLSPGSLAWVDQEYGAKTINVQILDNALLDGNKSFGIALSSPTGGASLATPESAVVTITDDELPATVLLQDSFNTANTSINADLASRQSGTLSTAGFTEEYLSGNVIEGNRLKTASGTRLANDADLTSALTANNLVSFTISFDLANTGSNWVSPYLSTDPATDERGSARFGMYLQANNNAQVLVAYGDSGTGQSSHALTKATVDNLLGTSFQSNQSNSFSFVATPTTTTTGSYDLFINGAKALSNIPYSLGTGGSNGKISWENRNNSGGVGYYDNLHIDVTPAAAPNQPPVWTENPIVGGPAYIDFGYSGTLAGAANDPDSDALFFNKVNGPEWLSVASDGTLSGMPASGDIGVNSFTVGVSDGMASAVTATLQITVEGLNQPPVFLADPIIRDDAKETLAYNATIAGSASDPEDHPLTYSKVSGPAWLNVAPDGTLTGTPASSDLGANVFVVSVIDGGVEADTAELHITVVAIPELALSIADASFSENGGSTTATLSRPGTTGDLVVSLSSSDISEATVSATATITDGNTSVQVTITAVDDTALDGTQTVTITASASGYLSADATLEVTDDEVPFAVNAGSDQTVIMTEFVPWTPAEVTPAAWYDASDTTTITHTAGAVSQWRSKIGTNHINQGTASAMPTTGTRTINGHNVIDFDGASDFMSMASSVDLKNRQVLFVLKKDTVGAAIFFSETGRNSQFTTDSANPALLRYAASPSPYWTNERRSVESFPATDVILGGFIGTSDIGFSVNGTYSTSAGNAGGDQSIFDMIGRRGDGDFGFHDGVFAEIVILPTTNTADRQMVEGYLAHKWGVAGNLPADHPYKAAAPGGQSAVATLDGIITGGGLPQSYTWSKQSGPNAAVTFGDAAAASTNATFTEAGEYVLRLTAADGLTSGYDEMTITVRSDNQTPVWSASPVATVDAFAGAAYSATLAALATDADGDPLTFAKVSGPVWLVIAADGTLSGTAGSGDAGSNAFTVSVTDGFSTPVQNTLNIDVMSGYVAYITDAVYGIPSDQRGFSDDPDNDGLPNGVEAAFGTHPGQSNPGITAPSVNGTTITFTHPVNPDFPADVSLDYQWSTNLTQWYAGDGLEGPLDGPRVTITSVTEGETTTVTAISNQSQNRIFLRIAVSQD